MTEPRDMCSEVDDNMSDVIDGVADNALFDHMATCERCRDARYDAEQASLRVSDAGADHRFPEEMLERVLHAVDTRKPTSIAPSVGDVARSAKDAAASIGEAARSAKDALVRRISSLPAARASLVPPSRHRGLRARGEARPPSSRWVWLSLAAAAGLGVLWLSSRRAPEAPAPPPSATVASTWQGRVLSVERAFGSPTGLSQCARRTQACQPLAPGDVTLPGMRLDTDGLTRALVKLADGSVLALDRQTSFELEPSERRRGRLLSGNLVAEIERQVDDRGGAGGAGGAAPSPAIIDVPLGRVEVVGTKFAVRASEDAARVEVSRGSVKLVGPREQSVLVQAGEAAVLSPAGAPRVEAVLDLAPAFEWSTAAFQDDESAPDRGALGELIAKRPSDGQELAGAVQLTQHDVKVRIVDSIARTEISEVFENRADEVLEGVYRFPLPAGAQIERLALEVDGKLEEGAFVDREKAAAIWRGAVVNAGGKKPAPSEEIVWVPGPWRDPALLEWQRGGRFELRVFPIPKRGSRRIVLAYTETLPASQAERRYVYPLPRDPRGSTRIGRFTLDVQVRGHDPARGARARGYELKTLDSSPEVAHLAFDENDFTPRGDLAIAYQLQNPDSELRAWAYQPQAEPPPGAGSEARPVGTLPSPRLDDGRYWNLPGSREPQLPADAPYVALALAPALPQRARYEPRDYVLIADTSRSMIGESYRRAINVIGRIVREMDQSHRVTLLACDSSCQAYPGGYLTPGTAAAETAERFLTGIEPEGASDLAFAVERAAALRERKSDKRGAESGAPPAEPRSLRVIYVGDGTPTVGPIHPALLERAVRRALPTGATFSAIALGNDADRGALRVATRAGGGVTVPFTPGENAQEVALSVLGATYGRSLQNARVELPEGMVMVVPSRLGCVAAGGEEWIVARMTRPRVKGSVVLRGDVAGEPFEHRYPIDVSASGGQANAFVPRLYASVAIAELESSIDEAARKKSIELSARFNVASRYTSLLVLESPAMFKAFGLDNAREAPTWSGEAASERADSAGEPELSSRAVVEEPFEGAAEMMAASRAAAAPSSRGVPGGDSLGSEKARRSEGAGALDANQPAPGAAPAPAAPDDGSEPYGLDPRQQPLEPPQRPLELLPPPQRWVPMRRIWERVGKIEVPPTPVSPAALARRRSLEERVREHAESRDALRNLYIAEFLAGDLEAAARSAERWSEKDPLDVDALTARADLAAQRGERELAIRILGSVVDVRPGDYKAQWRLARLHRWAGRPELGCRYSLAVAQLMLRDAKLVSEAIGCARDVGDDRTADELLTALEPSVRSEVEQLARKRRSGDELSGDFRVQASWEGSEHDVDLVILDPAGFRVSWLGAPTRSVISATDVLSVHREALALRGASPGHYAIELVRSAGGSGPVRGTVSVRVGKSEQSTPFELDGDRTRVATVTLRNEAKLVPLQRWD